METMERARTSTREMLRRITNTCKKIFLYSSNAKKIYQTPRIHVPSSTNTLGWIDLWTTIWREGCDFKLGRLTTQYRSDYQRSSRSQIEKDCHLTVILTKTSVKATLGNIRGRTSSVARFNFLTFLLFNMLLKQPFRPSFYNHDLCNFIIDFKTWAQWQHLIHSDRRSKAPVRPVDWAPCFKGGGHTVVDWNHLKETEVKKAFAKQKQHYLVDVILGVEIKEDKVDLSVTIFVKGNVSCDATVRHIPYPGGHLTHPIG